MNIFFSKQLFIALSLFCFISSNVLAQCLGTGIPVLWTISPVPGTSLVLNANTTIPTGFTITLDANNLAAGLTGKITVNNGARLIIQNSSVLDVCAVCPALWTGIVVQPGGTVTMTNSTIKNAKIGIDLVNTTIPLSLANCNIMSSTFMDNLTGINIRTVSGIHLGFNVNNNFFSAPCRTTSTGINVVGGTGPILDLVLPLNLNTFTRLTTGIKTTNSLDLKLNNNNFNNVSTGVSMTMPVPTPNRSLLLAQGNNFNNCSSFGITLNGNSSANILSNNFNVGKTAINIANASPTVAGIIFIGDNTISNNENGILCLNLGASTTINQISNQISWTIPTSSTAARFGIKNTLCNNVTVAENWVTMNSPSTNAFTGIYHQNCDVVSIRCNRVYNNSPFSTGRVGFDFSRTTTAFAACRVYDNEDVKTQYGFRFTASTVGTYPVQFFQNRMDSETSAGLRLAGWGIGNQGALGSPSWNRWWGSGISRATATTPVSAFYINSPAMPIEVPIVTAACTFPSAGVSTPFNSPCLPAIVLKATANNQNDITIDDQLEFSETQAIETKLTDTTDKFYPNPATDRATYEIELTDNQSGSVQIFDLAGKVLSQKDLTGGYNKVEFDLSEMPNGMYLYKVMSDKTTLKTGKFVVQK